MIYQVPDHSYCSQHHLQVYHGLQLKINRFPVTRRSLLSQTEVIFLATETHGSSCILHHFFNNKILKFLITHNLKKIIMTKKVPICNELKLQHFSKRFFVCLQTYYNFKDCTFTVYPIFFICHILCENLESVQLYLILVSYFERFKKCVTLFYFSQLF